MQVRKVTHRMRHFKNNSRHFVIAFPSLLQSMSQAKYPEELLHTLQRNLRNAGQETALANFIRIISYTTVHGGDLCKF